MFKLTLVSTKGGVGKTSIAANLAGLLGDMGLRVLMVDADVQNSLSKYYDIEAKAKRGLFDVVTSGVVTPEAITTTRIPNVDLIYSDAAEANLGSWLAARMDRDIRLKNALRGPFVDENYDVILIDTQGAMGKLPIREAAALAADEILWPLNPEALVGRELLDGTRDVYTNCSGSREPFPPIRVVINKIDRSRDAKDNLLLLRRELLDNKPPYRLTISETIVPSAVSYRAAATAKSPVHRFEPSRSTGAMLSACEVMHRLAWEVFPNVSGIFAGTSEEEEVAESASASVVSLRAGGSHGE